MSATLPPPPMLGAPERFSEWRHGQDNAILRTWATDKRFIVHAMPTGSGKSLVYAVLTQMLETGKRAVILTSTKGLQDQVAREFDGLVADIRGMANYPCDMVRAGFDTAYEIFKVNNPNREPNCEEGPCHLGRKCALKDVGCHYYDKYKAAKAARVVLTNYSYWMAINRYSDEALGEFDLLILDEAHESPDELAGFMRQEISESDLERLNLPGLDFPQQQDGTREGWRQWAARSLVLVEGQLEELKRNPGAAKETKRAKEMATTLGILAPMGDDWIVENMTGYSHVRRYGFEPTWAAPYSDQILFCGIEQVVLFSATVRPKTLELLGVGSGEYDFWEYPSPYPPARRPLIHVPTIRLNFRTSPGELHLWLLQIDRIIAGRLDRKGIVHTVSYDRMRYVVENSEHRGRVLWNDPKRGGEFATNEVVARFKDSGPGTVLVSPSVGTGYDFPGTECEYQVIGKLSYPDTRSPVMAARVEKDKKYSSYLAMMSLIQATGRGMRGPKDQCETLIVDDNIKWFLKQNAEFAPRWFMETVRYADNLPAPLPKLVG